MYRQFSFFPFSSRPVPKPSIPPGIEPLTVEVGVGNDPDQSCFFLLLVGSGEGGGGYYRTHHNLPPLFGKQRQARRRYHIPSPTGPANGGVEPTGTALTLPLYSHALTRAREPVLSTGIDGARNQSRKLDLEHGKGSGSFSGFVDTGKCWCWC
jgi:hypothetical protein